MTRQPTLRPIVLRISVLALALLLGIPCAGAAGPPFAEAATQLNGEWRNADFVLKIDTRRAQASVDPSRPFEWRRFLVKDVIDDEIIFTIGADLYEARIEADTLTLTSTMFRGEHVLIRTPDSESPDQQDAAPE
jgi:hypothetical protein